MERTKHCCVHLWSVMALVAILALAVQASAQDTYLPWEGGSAYYAQRTPYGGSAERPAALLVQLPETGLAGHRVGEFQKPIIRQANSG